MSEQEPEHKCLLPPGHIPCEPRVHLHLFPRGHRVWAQLSNISASPEGLRGAPAGTPGSQAGVTHGWEAAEAALNPLWGDLQTALTSWLTAPNSSYYAKWDYLQNMQNLSFLAIPAL